MTDQMTSHLIRWTREHYAAIDKEAEAFAEFTLIHEFLTHEWPGYDGSRSWREISDLAHRWKESA